MCAQPKGVPRLKVDAPGGRAVVADLLSFSAIIGAGPDTTYVTAAYPVSTPDDQFSCLSDNPGKGSIGFLLGDDTFVAKFGFVSLDNYRFIMDDTTPQREGLCGGFVFETPGCATSGCLLDSSTDIKSYEGHLSTRSYRPAIRKKSGSPSR